MTIVKEVLIQLGLPEYYPNYPNYYPTITHAKVVSRKHEVARLGDDKIGYYDLWVAKGFIPNGCGMHEADGFKGLHFIIKEPEIFEIYDINIEAGIYSIETMKVLSQFLINTDRINGSVVINEYEI